MVIACEAFQNNMSSILVCFCVYVNKDSEYSFHRFSHKKRKYEWSR